MIHLVGRGEGKMWTKAHRARHDARLKEVVSMHAVGVTIRNVAAVVSLLGDLRLPAAIDLIQIQLFVADSPFWKSWGRQNS